MSRPMFSTKKATLSERHKTLLSRLIAGEGQGAAVKAVRSTVNTVETLLSGGGAKPATVHAIVTVLEELAGGEPPPPLEEAPPSAPKPRRTRESAWPTGPKPVVAGIEKGQIWEVIEPSGMHLEVEVRNVQRGIHGSPRVVCLTKNGKRRTWPASTFAKGIHGARLVRDVERRAS